MQRGFFIFILFVFSISGLYSQNDKKGILSGYIYDISDRESLIGANVYIKDLKLGNSTNTSGYFVISDVPFGEYMVTFSLIGYKTKAQKISISSEKGYSIKVYLESDAIKSKEVVVTAEPTRVIEQLFEKPVSKIELTPTQINKIPQVMETDLLRSLQTLPGIVSISDFSSALYIRGGRPDQNLYLLDGADVYNPEHAFGLFSTFNTDAIKRVDLSKGGFGAEYGGRLSSILNVNNLDGNRNNVEGNIGISLLSAKATIQSPIGEIGSISGSFRRTYFDKTIAKMLKGNIPDYYFYDGNLKAFFDIDDNNKLTVSYFGGQDDLGFLFDKNDKQSPGFDYDWGNTTGSINWKSVLSSKLFANFWITASRFSSNFSMTEFNIKEDNDINDLTIKATIDYYFYDNLNLKYGIEQKNFKTLYKEDFPGGMIDIVEERTQYTSFISFNWKPSVLIDIEAGVRYDYFDSDKNFQNIDPRLSFKYRLSDDMNLKFATGIYHQYLNRVERGFIAGIWATADKNTNGSTSYHYILGLQKEFEKVYQVEVEGYYKKYDDLCFLNPYVGLDINSSKYDEKGRPVYSDKKGLFNSGDGYTAGIEVLIRKDVGALTGWLGYAYTDTRYTIDGINQNKSFVPRHNRTSVVNGVVNLDLTAYLNDHYDINYEQKESKWLLGMNFVYSTGQPITVPGSAYTTSSLPNGMENGPFVYPAEINNYKLPDYIRMDVSITYEKHYDGWSLAPYLQIYNIGNRKNIFFITYDNKISNNIIKQEVDTFGMLPLLPSIGVNIKF